MASEQQSSSNVHEPEPVLNGHLSNGHAASLQKPVELKPKGKRSNENWYARQKRLNMEHNDSSVPSPWLTRKFAVGLAWLFIIYIYYAFTDRVAVPMIRREETARGSRTQGILFLVIFNLGFLMVVWSYVVLLATPPGFVKDHVPVTPSPEPPQYYEPPWSNTYAELPSAYTGNGHVAHATASDPAQALNPPREAIPEQEVENHELAGNFGTTIAKQLVRAQSTTSPAEESPETSTQPVPPPSHFHPKAKESSASPFWVCCLVFPRSKKAHQEQKQAIHNNNLEAPVLLQRTPHQVPVLLPYYRWCTRCERIKPYRAHHCRICGTCVLKMDHHCPWVGNCVGARNTKFFFVFLFWTTLWATYIFLATLLSLVPPTRPPYANDYVDPQLIVVICIAGFFGFFVGGLWMAHIRLISLNCTTIEDIGMSRLSDEEAEKLAKHFGTFSFVQHWRTQKRWDREWGRPRHEGNTWWLASTSANWEMVFGQKRWTWLLPVKASPHDEGLEYQVNPRYTKDGIWMPRTAWPKELQ